MPIYEDILLESSRISRLRLPQTLILKLQDNAQDVFRIVIERLRARACISMLAVGVTDVLNEWFWGGVQVGSEKRDSVKSKMRLSLWLCETQKGVHQRSCDRGWNEIACTREEGGLGYYKYAIENLVKNLKDMRALTQVGFWVVEGLDGLLVKRLRRRVQRGDAGYSGTRTDYHRDNAED
ncbi:hypothetical protein Tco_0763114 [Tanacetum coccineum]